MTLRRLIIAIAVAALAALAIIPALTILRAPMPTLSNVAHTSAYCAQQEQAAAIQYLQTHHGQPYNRSHYDALYGQYLRCVGR